MSSGVNLLRVLTLLDVISNLRIHKYSKMVLELGTIPKPDHWLVPLAEVEDYGRKYYVKFDVKGRV